MTTSVHDWSNAAFSLLYPNNCRGKKLDLIFKKCAERAAYAIFAAPIRPALFQISPTCLSRSLSANHVTLTRSTATRTTPRRVY